MIKFFKMKISFPLSPSRYAFIANEQTNLFPYVGEQKTLSSLNTIHFIHKKKKKKNQHKNIFIFIFYYSLFIWHYLYFNLNKLL
jgi:hypothetical protein